MRPGLRLIAACGLAATVGCATRASLTIEAVEPSLMELGSIRQLVLVEGSGRPSAQAAVRRQIARQARATGYFSVQDRSREGHTVQVVGRRADLDGGRRKMPPGQAGLRIAILEWRSHREAQSVVRRDDDGKTFSEVVPFRHGSVVLEISLFDDSGRAHLAEREYEGFASGEVSRLSREIVLDRAARDAVARFLDSITPHRVARTVPLDDEDPEQASLLEAARSGAIGRAASQATAYVQSHPRSASAAYNLAVLLDALGDPAEALPMYDRAITLGGKEFYGEGRAGCARRLAAQRALEAGPMPASLAPQSR